MARKPADICYYEVVSDRQCTYFDLDLKMCDCKFLPPKLQHDNLALVRQFLALLEWGYRKYLDLPLDLDAVTIGNGCGKEKISFHVMLYDNIHC